MKIRLMDGSVFQISRLQMNYGNSFGGAVFDNFMITKEEVDRVSVDVIMAAFREDNIKNVTYILEDGKEMERHYQFIQEKRYLLGDTISVLSISLTQEAMKRGGGMEGEE